jgi:ABC-type multidrug transport system permease subunit
MGSARNCYVSPATYEKIMNFNLQNFQVSVLVDNETNVEKVVSKVETGAYYCSAKALIVNENQVLLATVLEVVVVVAVIAISLGLSLIVYSIIKNILNSQHKAFLIMRSLGIDGKNISIQIYVMLAFTLLISFVVIFFLWLLFKLRNFGGFFVGIHNSSFFVVLLIYIISTAVFAFLGFKYSTSVIHSSIVNKEME